MARSSSPMPELYPPESQRMDFIGHLAELRRRIIASLLFFAAAFAIVCAFGNQILSLLKQPAAGLIGDFVFLSPTEAFSAYIKVVMLAAFVFSFPVFIYELWAFLVPALSLPLRRVSLIWIGASLIFFYSGVIFSFQVLLPVSVKFLITFGREIARPLISINEYVSFASAIILMGGVIFQIPVVAGLLTEAGLMGSRQLAEGRRYAVLIILIVAAIVSPTQDIFSLFLFSLPMFILYEVGVFFSRWAEHRKKAGAA